MASSKKFPVTTASLYDCVRRYRERASLTVSRGWTEKQLRGRVYTVRCARPGYETDVVIQNHSVPRYSIRNVVFRTPLYGTTYHLPLSLVLSRFCLSSLPRFISTFLSFDLLPRCFKRPLFLSRNRLDTESRENVKNCENVVQKPIHNPQFSSRLREKYIFKTRFLSHFVVFYNFLAQFL